MAKESTFCFRVNAIERAQLEAIAFAQGRSSSAVAREVLGRFLEGFYAEPEGQQVLEQFHANQTKDAEIQRKKLAALELMLIGKIPAEQHESKAEHKRPRQKH